MWQNDDDPVDAQCTAMTPESLVDWMIQYHGAAEGSRTTLVLNVRSQMKWHRLQGRLDRHPILAILAQLMGMRQHVKTLATPKEP